MSKSPGDLSAVQEFLERFWPSGNVTAATDVTGVCLNAGEMGPQGRASEHSQVWVVTTGGGLTVVREQDSFEAGIPESFNVLVKELKSLGLNVDMEKSYFRIESAADIPGGEALLHLNPMLTSGDLAGWNMARRMPATYELATVLPGLDQLCSVSESLAEQATAHADAVERRGDEIDGLLGRIRASMSAARLS